MVEITYPDIPAVRDYLRELAANNTRDWFTANKNRYEATLRQPAQALLDILSPSIAEIAGAAVTPKLFRPHRDLRFSKDKTPYHTHLHMSWALPEGPGWLFGMSPQYVTAGVGVMGLAKTRLSRYRDGVAGPYGADLADALDKLSPRMDAPELKRVPAAYDADHPRADLLRRKSLVVWNDDIEGQGALPERLIDVFEAYRPISDWLSAVLSE